MSNLQKSLVTAALIIIGLVMLVVCVEYNRAHAAVGAATIMAATVSNNAKSTQAERPKRPYKTIHYVKCVVGSTVMFDGEVYDLYRHDRVTTFYGIDPLTGGSVGFHNLPCLTRLLKANND